MFNPQRTHVEVPALLVQERDLLGAAGPRATVADEKSKVEYPSVHWADAGCLPDAFNEMFKATVLPGVPVAEDKLSVAFCAIPQRQEASANSDVRAGRCKIAK